MCYQSEKNELTAMSMSGKRQIKSIIMKKGSRENTVTDHGYKHLGKPFPSLLPGIISFAFIQLQADSTYQFQLVTSRALV